MAVVRRRNGDVGAWRTGLWEVLAALLLLSTCLRPASGQEQDLRYLRHQGWTTEDGLPQDSVHGIAQTRDGYLWVGTEGGLARFDGVSFRVFPAAKNAAFVSGDVSCLLASGDALWVGTADGLVRVQDGGERLRRFAVKDGLPSATILTLRLGSNQQLEVETAAGWAVLQGATFAAVDQPASDDHSSNAARQGWQTEQSGVSWGKGKQGRRWALGKDLPGSRVESLLPQPSGAWVGTNAGLFLLRTESAEAEAVASLRGDTVLVLFRDHEDDLWIGTESSGLHVLRAVRFRTEPGLAGEGVVALTESGGAVWAGTRRDGVRLLQGGKVSAIPQATMTSPVVLSMAPTGSGDVWVGTPDGLNRVRRDGRVRHISSADGLPDDYVLALEEDGGGGVWAGTRRGLAHIRADLSVVQVLTRGNGLAGDLVGALRRTRAGELWIGTSGGVSRMGADGKVRPAQAEVGPGLVRALAEDREGGVWLATSEGWISRVHAGASATLHGPAVRGGVEGLLINGDVVWLRTDRGVDAMRVDEFSRCVREGCAPKITEYGVADGMPSAEIAGIASPVAWRMSSGELWFGTRHGIGIVNPGVELGEEGPPPVVIEKFTADGTELVAARAGDQASNRSLEIPYGPVRFSIEYAGLSFAAPSKVRYRYRLDGLDRGWTEVGGRRTATYTNLRPGRYRFEVEAANADGHWATPGDSGAGSGAELRFRVIPPIYRRWWFVLLLALCGAGVVVGLYLLRLRRLRREFDAVLRERNRMAREIHDTLAQDFVGVSLKLDIVLQLLKRRKVEAAEEQVRETRLLVTEGLAEARQSIWGLRANAAADSLPARFTRLVGRFRGEGLEVQWKVGGAYRQVDERVESEVLRVGQEALQNVRRHAGVAQAKVELQYRRDMLVLTVEDQGRGFAMAEAERLDGHYGVRGMLERAAAVGGRLDVTTAAGEGTRVELICPIAEGVTEVEA